jgi:hypothetical protein
MGDYDEATQGTGVEPTAQVAGGERQGVVDVRVRYRPGRELPAAEGLWAEPVDAHEGGGTYRLANNACLVPLAAGDLVRAELDGHGSLQVTDLVEPVPALLTLVDVDESVPDDVDFELDRTPPDVVDTDYWAADDPTWRGLGLDDPGFLAFVQRLAGEDARVARALEKGQHDRVLMYIERITAEDPRTLAPLDGPIFGD